MNERTYSRGRLERIIELLVGVSLALVGVFIVVLFIFYHVSQNDLPASFGMVNTHTTKISTTSIEEGENGKPVETTTTKEFLPPKTLWDWLELIVVPATLALSALWFNYSQRIQKEDIARNQREEEMLSGYYRDIAYLISDLGLGTSNETTGARPLATARTKALLHNLNIKRKGLVIRYLYDAKLIGYLDEEHKIEPPIISLMGADLSGIDLENADLAGIQLKETVLTGANLVGVNMYCASLRGADLRDADLRGPTDRPTTFIKADLTRADLRDVKHNDRTHIITALSLRNTKMSPDLESKVRPGLKKSEPTRR